MDLRSMSLDRASSIFRRYVWNRTTFTAIVIASPAILTAIGSIATTLVLDRDISELGKRRDTLTLDMSQLDGFTKDVETYQLGRAALLLTMNAGAADQKSKFMLDKLFRLNAMGSMRRVAAIIYPERWKDRLAAYDGLLAEDYEQAETVQKLQAIESTVIKDASRRLTALQQQLNETASRIEFLNDLKSLITNIGNYLVYILTIMVFFIKTNAK